MQGDLKVLLLSTDTPPFDPLFVAPRPGDGYWMLTKRCVVPTLQVSASRPTSAEVNPTALQVSRTTFS